MTSKNPWHIISIKVSKNGNAFAKARLDIEKLAINHGMKPLYFKTGISAEGKIWAKITLALQGILNCLRICRLEKNAVIFVQYPLQPSKSVYLFNGIFALLKKLKGYRYVALIHDLDSLRGLGGRTGRYSDVVFLKKFDVMICHNERMRDYLIEQGIAPDRLVTLGLFDYLYDEAPLPAERVYSPSINIAANLSPEKSGYVYCLAEGPERDYTLHLYGLNYTPRPDAARYIHYHGVVAAEKLREVMEGCFGLVWDGNIISTCSGGYGEYMRYNNPHKVSLYLSCGLPVIIWKEAALAPFIVKNNLGIAITSLNELEDILCAMNKERYNFLVEHVMVVAREIMDGGFFYAALDKVVKKLEAYTLG